MRPILHAPDCEHQTLRCTCGATFRELMRRHEEWKKGRDMTDAQIKHMVDRFLRWRLPEDFTPDAGISFTPDYNIFTAHPMKHEPTGTNLFNATQAEAMVRHMVGGWSGAQ